jgi:hypothetical protein
MIIRPKPSNIGYIKEGILFLVIPTYKKREPTIKI